jgi:hypothetical protein
VTQKANSRSTARFSTCDYQNKPNDLIRDNVVWLDVKATPGERAPKISCPSLGLFVCH